LVNGYQWVLAVRHVKPSESVRVHIDGGATGCATGTTRRSVVIARYDVTILTLR